MEKAREYDGDISAILSNQSLWCDVMWSEVDLFLNGPYWHDRKLTVAANLNHQKMRFIQFKLIQGLRPQTNGTTDPQPEPPNSNYNPKEIAFRGWVSCAGRRRRRRRWWCVSIKIQWNLNVIVDDQIKKFRATSGALWPPFMAPLKCKKQF